MKLSEAMRAGAKLVPQATGRMFLYERDAATGEVIRITAACALGCAFIGLHPEAVDEAPMVGVASSELDLVWPELNEPVPGWTDEPLGEVIALMNDHQGRYVEEIADRLALAGL